MNRETIKQNLENRALATNLARIATRLDNPETRKYMISKIVDMAKLASSKKLIIFLSALLKYPDGVEAVKSQFEQIKLGCLNNRNIYSAINQYNGIEVFFNVLDTCKGIPQLQEKYDLYDFFREIYTKADVLKDCGFLTAYVEAENRESLKSKIFKKMLKSKYAEEIKALIEHVSQNKEFDYYAMGATSFIFKTGDQVIKLGCKFDFEVPYHPRLMMPYFRRKYDTGLSVEVFNFANIGKSAGIKDEQLLEIYKELEEAGIFWGDAKVDNLGILLKDNNLPDFIASKEFNVFGFSKDPRFPTNEHQALPAGSIIITDLDFIYAQDDPNRKVGNPALIIRNYWKAKRRNNKMESNRNKGDERE